MTFKNFALVLCLIVFIQGLAFAKVNFKDEILPLFEDYCIDCHGPNKSKSGFRVDRRVHLLKGGDSGLSAVIPAKPDKSYMIEVIKSDDPEIGMPPKGGKLFEEIISIIEKVVDEIFSPNNK